MNREQRSGALEQAAKTTLDYLTSTLYDDETGVFLSFQIADTGYYLLSEEIPERSDTAKGDGQGFYRSAGSDAAPVDCQIDELIDDDLLTRKTRKSVDFLARNDNE